MTSRAKGGRPSKLTPKVRETLVEAIRAGAFLEPACQYAGVHYSTFRRWMVRGEQATSGEYRELFEEITRAENKAEIHAVTIWQKAIVDGDWRAARDFLRCRFPERWSPVQKIAGPTGGPVPVETDVGKALAAVLRDPEAARELDGIAAKVKAAGRWGEAAVVEGSG